MDVFDTAALRSRVLAAWAASPARFREDANAEEELVRGAYRDRLVVELAQNAADAAVRAGVPGRLLLRCDQRRLVAANVGAALDPAGVEALSTLRASAKRDDDPAETVGRFGVGFAAVLAVTDAPSIISRSGGVRWSRDHTVEEIATVPELADELARRQGCRSRCCGCPSQPRATSPSPMTRPSSCRYATARLAPSSPSYSGLSTTRFCSPCPAYRRWSSRSTESSGCSPRTGPAPTRSW